MKGPLRCPTAKEKRHLIRAGLCFADWFVLAVDKRSMLVQSRDGKKVRRVEIE